MIGLVYFPLALTLALTEISQPARVSLPQDLGTPAQIVQNADSYLVQGSQGEAVAALQQKLQVLGYYRGVINGNFDAATKEAVIGFQRAQGVAPDGIVGPRTLGLIIQARPPAPAPNPTALLAMGSQGTRVRSLQQRLRSLGYYRGAIDGSFEAGTKDAVIRFQRDRGLPPDGIVGEQTFAALGNAAAGTRANAPAQTSANPTALAPERVRELQQRLQQLGFYRGPLDGLWGPATQTALEKAQQTYGVSRADISQ
ncbi:peptidoglycan-binding protein [Oscillatoria sp. FACHB-1406]|uniref:peptidoglycan-binding domain-containing protein n=1 Tax=Oscillatoria sp. FACHB-1406 TaxID=2692846 RepID=UPI001686D0E8|nr:peptidoglycan-binding protein [Oscillatoria sp. FACHB-1406]MBD2577238.1 peptidoglycan-binding protein [Oscillatoria sp. FACHB-1406]